MGRQELTDTADVQSLNESRQPKPPPRTPPSMTGHNPTYNPTAATNPPMTIDPPNINAFMHSVVCWDF